MIKVLWANGGIMDRGGVAMSMMNYYRHIDKNRIHIDFMVHGKERGAFDDEIEKSGSRIYHITPKHQSYTKNVKEIKEVLSVNKYDIIHSQADTGNAHILKIAKRCGIPVRISHSHNTDLTLSGNTIINRLRIKYNNMQKKKIRKYATYMCGCSVAAFEWLHGNARPIHIIHNALEVEKFKYNEIVRQRIRNDYGITNKYVFGCVGRLDYQKNYDFLLEVFAEYKKDYPQAILMIVGNGPLKDALENKIQKMDLCKNVILVGQVDNPHDYYSAFDVFLMPSLFEGLGIACIEAQINGLPCVLSNHIPQDSKITQSVKFIELNAATWLAAMRKTLARNPNAIQEIKASGYNIAEEAKKLEELYENSVQLG